MNLKKRLLSLSNVIILAFLLATASNLQAQVGIASSSITPDASAMLEVRSSSKGFLGPRVSLTGTTDNTTISNTPVKGLLVYNLANVSDVTEGFYYFDGTSWVRIATGSNSSGQLLNVQVFTSGSGTYAPTSGTTRAEIILVGGGGGGGNAATTVSDKIGAMGGGGGSGTLLNAYIPISILNNNYSYSVGAGGGSFTDGGPTSLGGLIAPGGSKGEQMTTADNTTTTKLGGSGGTAATTISNANAVYYSILGTKGGDGVKNKDAKFIVSGVGGSCPYGSGGASVFAMDATVVFYSAGVSGSGYGSGGSGAAVASNNVGSAGTYARDGGSGKGGIIIIHEYR